MAVNLFVIVLCELFLNAISPSVMLFNYTAIYYSALRFREI